MEENKDINVHSETVDKVIDIVANSTEQTRNVLDKNMAGFVDKFFQLIASTPLAIKIESYIAERPYKLEQAKQKMLEKYNKIPTENLTEPRTSTVLTVAKEFDYYLDEEYIKEMFINILISDMDNRKQSKVHPSFINIVKELSQEDAKILKKLKELCNLEESIIRLKYVNPNSKAFLLVNNNIFIITSTEAFEVSYIVLNNLIRLGILEIDFTVYNSNDKIYETIFEHLKTTVKPTSVSELSEVDFDKGLIKITELGEAFIDICLS